MTCFFGMVGNDLILVAVSDISSSSGHLFFVFRAGIEIDLISVVRWKITCIFCEGLNATWF